MSKTPRTQTNLQVALASEADASRRYTAYGIRALQEGHIEVAQYFLEAAGAETVHAYAHLLALDAIGTTVENLQRATQGEMAEVEQRYPRMIAEAEAEGAQAAAASFRLALEREKKHQDMFRAALVAFQQSSSVSANISADLATAAGNGHPSLSPPASPDQHEGRPTAGSKPAQHRTPNTSTENRQAAKRGLAELKYERERIAWLAGIREIVFGGQDGLISTAALVAGIAATTTQSQIVLIAGALAAVAGALSMSVGSYLSTRAQRHVFEAELAAEQREIAEKPGEEIAELLAALTARGLSRQDAAEVVRRLSAHPRLMLDLLGIFELGLVPGNLGSPLRDALVMGGAFVVGAAVPLLPFIGLEVMPGLMIAALLTLGALFILGAVKGYFSKRSLIASGLEVMLLGGASGGLGYGLGQVVSGLFGIHI